MTRFFPAKTRPEGAVGMFGTEVGALFRLSSRLPALHEALAAGGPHESFLAKCLEETGSGILLPTMPSRRILINRQEK
jgi:hypothetical protein